MMETPPIPEEWLRLQIGDIADVVAGGTPNSSDSRNFTKPRTGISWLTPADLSGYKEKYISHGARDLTLQGYSSSSAKILPVGSILFSSRAPIGYVAIANNEISTNQGFKSFVLPTGIDSSFAYYFFRSIKSLAENLGTGTTFKELSSSTAKTLPFLLAPLAEQKIIAEKLDIMLAKVESTRIRLERILFILKRFRQSVLSSAVNGKLTEEWRSQGRKFDNTLNNLQREKKLWIEKNGSHNEAARVLKRVKEYSDNKIYTDGELFDNWSWGQLEDCVLMIVDCHNKTAPYTESGIPLIRTSNIRDGGFIWKDLKFVSNETYKHWSRRCTPEAGDIIFTREAPMGEAAIIPSGHQVCLGQRTMLIRPVENCVLAKYLLIALLDPNFKKQSEAFAVGTGVKHYRVGDVSNLVIAIPPTEEQIKIIQRVEQFFAFANFIEQKTNAALERVNKLPQSLLTKAFRGELTAEWRAVNPDLISGENSVGALLKNIKTERKELKKQPKPKKTVVQKKVGSSMSKKIIKVVEALNQAGEPLNGQQLLAASGYPNDCSTEKLEEFFLDIREALSCESIVKLNRSGDGQDWFSLAEAPINV